MLNIYPEGSASSHNDVYVDTSYAYIIDPHTRKNSTCDVSLAFDVIYFTIMGSHMYKYYSST